MRRIHCDQYEFDPPDSEQSLDLVLAAPSIHFPDLQALLSVCGASAADGPAPRVGWVRWDGVAANLERFGQVILPPARELQRVILLEDRWDELEIGIAFRSLLVWYRWTTSA